MPSRLISYAGGKALQAFEYREGKWVPISQPPHPAMVADAFSHDNPIYQGTIWAERVDGDNVPLDPRSAEKAQWMYDNSPDPWGARWQDGKGSPAFGSKTALNTSKNGTQPIAAYVVDSTHPSVEWAWMECKSDGMSTVGWDTTHTPEGQRGPAAGKKMLNGRIPLPKGALPAQGGDQGMALYDVGSGLWREYFGCVGPIPGKSGPNGEPYYTASVGGWSVNKPGRDISGTNFATQTQSGQSAVACMHNSLGFIHPDEVRAGKIEHALAFTFGAVACDSVTKDANGRIIAKHSKPSWPAAGSDAKAPPEQRPFSPIHGQWGRIRKDVDPMKNPRTGLPYNPLTRLLIRAAQKYGVVGTDTNCWAHAFNTHSGVPEMLALGKTVDPWTHEGELAKLLNPEEPAKGLDISDFPWDCMEWIAEGYRRPLLDFYQQWNAGEPYADPKAFS